ncbi:MAG: CBS domain-containing protein [Thermomicrobiales bacterium]
MRFGGEDKAATPVSEAMTPDPMTVPPGMSAVDLARKLLAAGIGGAPVVDAAGLLIGMVSDIDVLGKPGATVGEIMSRGVVSVREVTRLDEVVALMGLHGIRRVPVVRDGRLVGIVSRAQLLRRVVESEDPAPEPGRHGA